MELSLNSYIHSCDFMVDYMPIRKSEDIFEWSEIKEKPGKNLMWLNGHLMNVGDALRVTGTIDEFAAYVAERVKPTYGKDYEYRYCADMVRSLVEDMHISKTTRHIIRAPKG